MKSILQCDQSANTIRTPATTLFASCGELSNSHASTRESNVQEKADRITFHTVFQLVTKLTDEEDWVMRLFSKENQECSMMIFHSETFGFELEAMVCAVRDGTLIDQ